MREPLVLVDTSQAGVAVLTLNRPQAMSALSKALCHALCEAVHCIEADPNIRVLVVTGGGRAACRSRRNS
ncbi:hypothetical protein FAZ69_07785 [Trinickia terrae]|uniref:Enoyl-CoA hydratase/isomerase family protein n=1 Tax=Trinickia terrae TaxID=2571161 RepID=A0A4U1I9P5_9BURK|nr:hypothetical protein FAZ69_07785 [Trinickia terrae]